MNKETTGMKRVIKFWMLAAFVLAAATAAQAQSGVICGFPRNCVPAYKFKPYELPFSTGRQAKFKAGDHVESDYFYAVVLGVIKTADTSEGDDFFFNETKRLAAQKLFPDNKVFASRCCGNGGAVSYEGLSDTYNFLAVHGGENEEDATRLLSIARRKYPSAEIKRMRVILDFRPEKERAN